MRLGCDHCFDTYDEDNLEACARCGADTCWKCAIIARLPELASGNWWCDRCLNEVGRADLLIGKRRVENVQGTPPRRTYDVADKFYATEALREVIAKSNPGSLPWPADKASQDALVGMLERMGVDVKDESPYFKTSPPRMPQGEGELEFTEWGYIRFAYMVLAEPPWKGAR